ncbi:MAG TPA: hypothetical protein EYH34_13640 [Planctomycetes bacterium]|nr:hypothetical protein [Planctomycetota bacterium]
MTRSVSRLWDHSPLGEALAGRPTLPSWLISMLLHMLLLIALALVLPARPRQGAAPERIADVGIVLKREQADSTVYQSQGESGQDTATAVGGEQMGAERLEAILPVEAPLDPTAALPAPLDILGASMEGEGVASAGGATAGPGGNTRALGGRGRTSVFGVPGEGYKFAYVFDRSASMGGSGRNALGAAKAELIRSLESLEPTHQFMIIFYNEFPTVFNPSGRPGKLPFATERNKQRARRFVEGIIAAGGTRHREALLTAIRTQPDVIFFLTDADEPRLSDAQVDEITRRAGGITINTIEFGLGPKQGGMNFLEKLARQSGGGYAYVDIATELRRR